MLGDKWERPWGHPVPLTKFLCVLRMPDGFRLWVRVCRPLTRDMGVLVLGEAVCVCVWKNFVSSSQFFSKATATEKKKSIF